MLSLEKITTNYYYLSVYTQRRSQIHDEIVYNARLAHRREYRRLLYRSEKKQHKLFASKFKSVLSFVLKSEKEIDQQMFAAQIRRDLLTSQPDCQTLFDFFFHWHFVV